MISQIEKVECDFTLALNNRTGKYFFCKELIEETADLIKTVHYWRLTAKSPPSGFAAKVLGKCSQKEAAVRSNYPKSYEYFPPISRKLPVIFTDPRECVLYSIKPWDIVICHDMGPLTHPELYHPGVFRLYRCAFARIVAARPHMVFVSEATRDEFVNLYGKDFPYLSVVHIPLRQAMDGDEMSSVSDVPQRYLLTVGAIGTRKNQLRSIEAFARSGLAHEGYAYVLCGGPEPGYDSVALAAQRISQVKLVGHVSDSQLRWLYRHARGFVLPSLLEGFGLPAAEAIRFNLVPLIGGGGALQEVTGDQAILVDPLNTEEIASGMRRLAEMNETERADRISALKRHVTQFSRNKTMSAWREALQASLKAANDAQYSKGIGTIRS
jgi:glycosyltransferase involved in cell wall biosynthesis